MSAVRRSVPVDGDLLADIDHHPEAFGLSPRVSEAARLKFLLELGASTARAEQERELMEAAYQAWAQDDERVAIQSALASAAVRKDGVFARAIGKASAKRRQ
jgi:hypothetical protein